MEGIYTPGEVDREYSKEMLKDFENWKKEIALKNLSFKNISDREKRYNYRVLEKIYKKVSA